MTYRATRKHQPQKSDTLVSSPEQARALISSLDKKLAGKLKAQERATYLCARAVLYEALGDRRMLEAANEAFAYSKTAQSAALVAVALHHFGRIKEAIQYYKQSYRFPHEAGFEVDIGMQGALLFEQTVESWKQAWEITKGLKKRICYAAFLPTWDGRPVKELQILSEGGFGDLIQNARYLSKCTELAEHVTVFLPPYFFEHGFVDLARRNEWWPETKLLTDVRAGVPSAGFFDLPAIFETTPDNIPDAPVWAAPECIDIWMPEDKPRIGLTFAARAMETPICAENVYRAISKDLAEELVRKTNDSVYWVNLQKGEHLTGTEDTNLKSWEDTAAIISNLDAVVCVDTAVTHLAASLGKPTWVILSGAVDWKWGIEGDTCPWYKNIRIFRNGDFGFDHSISNVIAAINNGELNGSLHDNAGSPSQQHCLL